MEQTLTFNITSLIKTLEAFENLIWLILFLFSAVNGSGDGK